MISLLDTTSDSSTVTPALSEPAALDSTVPFAIPVPETESAFATGNAESDTAAQRAMKEKRLYALQSVCLLDRDAKFRQQVPEDLSYMLSERALSDRAGQDLLIGDEFARTVSNEDVYGALERYIEQAAADKQSQMRERLRGCKTEADGKRLLGQLFRQEVQDNYERDLKHQQEMERKKEELGQALSRDLPAAIIEGRGLNPELMDQAQQFGNSEKILGAYQRARAAFDYLRAAQRGGLDEATYETRVRDEYARLKKKSEDERRVFNYQMLTYGFSPEDAPSLKPISEKDLWQQARSNLGGSYEINRSSIVNLLNMLSDEQGRFDEQAWSALMLALDADATGQQTIDSRFLRNFAAALERFGSQTSDTFGRQIARSGMVALPNTFPAPLTRDEQERFRRLYAPDVEKIKGGLALIEEARLTPSDRASFVSGMLTESGSVAGESMPAVLANMIVPGGGGIALSAAAMYPALSNEAVARNYFEGKRNAETLGLIQGAFQAGAEGLFGAATRSIPVVSRMMDRAALKMSGVPVVGKMLGTVQGNAMLRYAVDSVALESLGELVVEDVVAETGTYLTVEGARALGVDFDQYEWNPYQTAWQNFQDSRQVGATVAYCAALGLLGVRPHAAAARQFAQSQQAMLAAGLTEKSARRIARLEQQQRERVPELLERQEAKLGRRLTEQEAQELVEPLENELKEEMRSSYETDVLDADPVQLSRRLEKNHKLYLSEAESQVALREGVLKAALREMGVLDTEPTITGKNLVTLEVPGRGSDSAEHKVVEWTDEQLAAYARYALGEVGLRRMREIRSSALAIDMAEQLNQQGKDYAKMLPISEAAAPVAVELAKSHGMMNLPVLRALASAAKREGDAGVEVLPGVRNRVVASLADSFEQRLDVAEALGELSQSQAQDVRAGLNDAVGAAAVRLPSSQGPASRILYNPGHTMSVGIAEDAVEAMLTARLRRDGGIDDDGRVTPTGQRWLDDMMAEMRRVNELVRSSTGAELMPGLDSANPDLQTVTEYFSHLVQSDFYRRAGHYGLGEEAQKHVNFMDAALMQGRYLDLIDHGFAQWVRSEEGRAWESAGGTLAGLLNEAGLELGSLYNSSRVRAEAVAAVEEARAYMRDPSAGGKVSLADLEQTLELAGQEQQERDQPSLVEQDVPAEDSVTGEAIPDDGGEAAAAYTADGQLVAPLGSEVQQEPLERGAGLVDGAFAAMADGSVMGVARVEDIGLCPDVPQFKTKKAAAGRERASEDGTTHELSGGFRKDSPPITVWRRKNGALQVITGRHRLAHAKKNGEAFISVRVYDEDATHDASWAKLYDVEMNILDRQAGAQDVAYFFRNSRMTLQEAESRGLMPRRKDGEQTATGTIGIAVALQACDEVYTRFINGALSERNAYFIATLGVDAPAQELAAKLLSGSKPKSLEYVRAYVTAAEEQRAASDEPAMFDLFGHDESWAQEADKLARYVEAVRKHLSAQLSILQSGSSLKRKGEAAGKLGISIKTPQDLTRLLSEMVVLDAALERMDPELGLGRLAAEWDGSGTPDVEGSGLMNYAANLVVGMKSAPSFSLVDMRKTRVRMSAKDVAEMSVMPNLRMDVDSLDQVYEMAKAGMDDIRNAIESVGRDLGLFVKMRKSLKGRERANYKVRFDYEGDAGKLLDVYGGTIVLQPGDSFTDVIEAVKAKGVEVVRVKNVYAHSSRYGYADIKLNLRTRHGFIGELILIEQHMMEVKGEVGHLIYEVARKITNAIKSEPDSVKKARLNTLQEALAHYSQGLYQGADYNDMKELRKRALDACQEAKAKLNDYVSAEIPELEAVLGKLQQGEEYYSTRAQNSFSVTSQKSYGRLSYEGFSGNDQRVYFPWYMDKRYQLPRRSSPHTLSVSMSSANQKKSILETASRNSSRVSNEVNIDNPPVSQGEEKSKNNFAKSASSAEEGKGILPLRTWEGWLQFEPDENAAGGVEREGAQAGSDGLLSSFSLAQQLDDAYMDALRRGDEETARKLVLEAAKAGGYVAESDYQGSKAFNGSAPGENGYFETERERFDAWKNGEFEGTFSLADFVRNGIDPNNLKWQISDDGAYIRAEDYTRESIDAIREAKASRSYTITIYRAVPKSVKEKSARNGDWVTLSEAYAKLHISLQDWDGARIIKQTVPIDHVWWDGNDINEWGYDDGKEYAYRNTANNRKSLATVTYDANRNIIPLSQRFNPRKSSVSFSLTPESATTESDFENELALIRKQALADGSFMRAPNGARTNLTERQWLTVRTQAFKNWFGDWENAPEDASKVVDENGEPKVVYHGTARADRVGNVFRPDRATSGPMAFFTDNAEIAANYARNKEDTSLEYENEDLSDYRQRFRVKLPYFEIPFHKYWGYIPFSDRARLTKLAGHIRDDYEGSGGFVVDEENDDGSGGFAENLRRARGNAFEALVYEWLDSGKLFNEEESFMEIIDILDLPYRTYYKDPNYREEKVYKVFMRIDNPFITSKITKRNINSLRAAAKKAKPRKNRQADSWDKNQWEPMEWVSRLEEDYAAGTDYVWTSIPDWVSNWLKSKDYDGIIDRGGKYHETNHVVYVPFESEQIKSATDNRGKFDKRNPDITFSLMAGSGESYSLSVGGAARAALEPFGKEAMLERMARNIEKAERSWKQAFAGRDPMESRDVAAEQMGQLMALAMGVHRSLPEGYRARLDALLRRGNVLARMLESGRLRSYGQMNKAQRAELVAEVERGMLEEFPGLEAVGEGSGRKARAEALKAAREEVSRHVAERGLSELVVEMTEEAAGQMRRYLRDQEVRRIAALVDRFTPRVGKNGKMEKGKLEAPLYRRLAEIVQMMQASADVRDAQIAALQGRIAEAEAAGDTGLCDELTAKQMEWSTFGAIKSQSLESVRKARAELLSMLGNGQARWQFKLNREKARVDYIVKEALNAMGEADDARLAKQKSRAEKMSMWQKLRALPAYAQSIGQLFYGLSGIPGIERLADESSRAITDGHMALAARENELSRAMAAKLEELGFASNAQKADFMKFLKETVDTGIVPQKERERHRVKLEVEEARRWAAMSFEERAEERTRIRDSEKETRLKAQNVPLESDMPLLRAELSKVDASSRARRWVTIDREIEIDVKREPLRISRDQALNLILLCEQPRYKNGSAAAHGYTDEVLAKLRDFVGAEGMAFGYWMRDYLSRTGLQEVFESREGVPFPAEENYWPAAFDQSGKINENVNALDPATGQYSTRYSMLITRVNHKLSFDLTIGATNTFMGAMAMQNNYICMGSLTQLWRRLLSHQRFARSLRQRIGESRFKAIKEGMNLLDGQGVVEAYAQKQLSGIIGMFQGAHAPAVLAGSVTTLIKQISAIMHGASYPGINPFRLISQMLIDRLGRGRMTYKRMMDEAVFRERVGTREVWEEMARLGTDVTWSRLAAWSRAGMRFLEKSDVAANCASMTALYNVLWEKFQADNRSGAVKMSEEEMHRRCMQAVERTMDLSAQPMRRSQKALVQAVNQGIFNRLSFYMASEVMNKIGMVLATYQRGGGGWRGMRGAWKFLATMSVMEQLMCMAIDLIRGNGPDVDEDDTWAMWIACNLATGFLGVGLLSGVPILGSMVSHLSGGYVKTNAFADALGADVLSNGKKIWRMASGKKEYSPAEWALQIFNVSRAAVGGLGSFGGGAYSGAQFVSSATGLLQSVNAAFNVVRPFVPWFKTGKDEVRGSRGR